MVRHCEFEGVKGYATYAGAVKRGKEVAAMFEGDTFRWTVIALPSGRFAPMVVIHANLPGGPGRFMHLTNVCTIN